MATLLAHIQVKTGKETEFEAIAAELYAESLAPALNAFLGALEEGAQGAGGHSIASGHPRRLAVHEGWRSVNECARKMARQGLSCARTEVAQSAAPIAVPIIRRKRVISPTRFAPSQSGACGVTLQ